LSDFSLCVNQSGYSLVQEYQRGELNLPVYG